MGLFNKSIIYTSALIAFFPVFSTYAALAPCGKVAASEISPEIANGLIEIESMPSVQAWIATQKFSSICVLATPLGRDDYAYDILFADLVATNAQGQELSFPLVFQTASIQAYENTGEKPQLGIPAVTFNSSVAAILGGADWKTAPLKSVDPLDFATLLFQGESLPLSPGSLGAVYLPGFQAGWETYLVTEMRLLDTGNPFTNQLIVEAGWVQFENSTSSARYWYFGSPFDFLNTLEAAQQNSSK